MNYPTKGGEMIEFMNPDFWKFIYFIFDVLLTD